MMVKAVAVKLSSRSQETVSESVNDEVAVTVSPSDDNESIIFILHTMQAAKVVGSTSTVEPLIKGPPNKGHLSIKDKAPCPNMSFIWRFHCIITLVTTNCLSYSEQQSQPPLVHWVYSTPPTHMTSATHGKTWIEAAVHIEIQG